MPLCDSPRVYIVGTPPILALAWSEPWLPAAVAKAAIEVSVYGEDQYEAASALATILHAPLFELCTEGYLHSVSRGATHFAIPSWDAPPDAFDACPVPEGYLGAIRDLYRLGVGIDPDD